MSFMSMFFRYYFNAVFKLIPKSSSFDKSTRSYIHVVLSMFIDMSSKFGVAVDHQSSRNRLNCKRENFDVSSSCGTQELGKTFMVCQNKNPTTTQIAIMNKLQLQHAWCEVTR